MALRDGLIAILFHLPNSPRFPIITHLNHLLLFLYIRLSPSYRGQILVAEIGLEIIADTIVMLLF